MADWPTVEQVKSSLGVTTDARDDLIRLALSAAIEQVGVDIGYQDIAVEEDSGSGLFTLTGFLDNDPYTDESEPVGEILPNNSLSQAALILAVMAVKAPEAPYGIAAVFDLGALRVAADHPTYRRMLTGSHERFGIA